jgi:hypothetical protein
MKFTKENMLKRLHNWKTWVALFSLVGILLKTLGYANFEGWLGQIQEVVYMAGTLLGIWTDHEDTNDTGDG